MFPTLIAIRSWFIFHPPLMNGMDMSCTVIYYVNCKQATFPNLTIAEFRSAFLRHEIVQNWSSTIRTACIARAASGHNP